MSDYVRIFDTTLRDGEQSPGATMTSAEKLEVARTLSRLGVDVIETGFPAASPDDLHAVRTIAEQVGRDPIKGAPADGPPIIAALARTTRTDIDRAWDGVQPAHRPRIHTFLATSPIHREHKLRLSREQVLERIRDMVAYAKARCDDVEFSPEDAGRTELEFLYEVVETAVAAGATTVNIADTVGYTTPVEFGGRIAGIFANCSNLEGVTVSVHCHNDLGLATANTLAGIAAGARQAEVTINGIGERAGNTAMEEVVMALRTRKDTFGLDTRVDASQFARASKLVSTITGMTVQPNKAVVGANAFSHEAGIHQDGMLKHQETYEIMRPEDVGVSQTSLVLGKHSGRHAFAKRLEELGYPLAGEELNKAFERFKRLSDKKKYVTDADLVALVSSEIYHPRDRYHLEGLQVACGSMGMPTATARVVNAEGTEWVVSAVGTGPVDACFKAIDEVLQLPCTLLEYSVRSVTEGIDALGEVSVRIRDEGGHGGRKNAQHETERRRVFHGNGADTDIVVASARAYLAAVNRLLAFTEMSEQAKAAVGADTEGQRKTG